MRAVVSDSRTALPDGADTVLVAAPLADSPLVAELFAAAGSVIVVALDELRVAKAWEGRLFDLLGSAREPRPSEAGPPGVARDRRTVGLLVPLRWLGPGPAPDVVAVSDHLNARLRGPLTGRRPVSGPRAPDGQPFPSMTGVYQPETIAAACRSSVRRRVYSVSAVAGVTDAARLTPFEQGAVAAGACAAVCDCLVDAVVVAALHGLRVAAAGVPTAANP